MSSSCQQLGSTDDGKAIEVVFVASHVVISHIEYPRNGKKIMRKERHKNNSKIMKNIWEENDKIMAKKMGMIDKYTTWTPSWSTKIGKLGDSAQADFGEY